MPKSYRGELIHKENPHLTFGELLLNYGIHQLFFSMNLKARPYLFYFLPLVVLMSSCLKRDLEDLEKQVQALEQVLGTNEPLVIDFATTNSSDVAIVKKTSFGFK